MILGVNFLKFEFNICPPFDNNLFCLQILNDIEEIVNTIESTEDATKTIKKLQEKLFEAELLNVTQEQLQPAYDAMVVLKQKIKTNVSMVTTVLKHVFSLA